MITLFRKHWRTELLLTMFLPARIVHAAPLPLECPPSIPISAPQPDDVSQEWQVSVISRLYLNSAAPISGPPELHGDLANFKSKPGKIAWSYTYDLDRHFPDGKWLECGYGTYNQVTLSKPLPDTTKSCTFTYRKGQKAGQHEIKIRCQ